MQLRSFGKGFTVLEDRLASELAAEERELARDLRDFEKLLEKVGRGARPQGFVCLGEKLARVQEGLRCVTFAPHKPGATRRPRPNPLQAEKSAAEKVLQEEALVVEEVESLWSKLAGLVRGGRG